MFFSNGQPLQNHWISYTKGPRLKILKSNPLTNIYQNMNCDLPTWNEILFTNEFTSCLLNLKIEPKAALTLPLGLGYGARAEIPEEVSVFPPLIGSLMHWKAPTTSNRLAIFWPVTRSFVTVRCRASPQSHNIGAKSLPKSTTIFWIRGRRSREFR